MIEEQSSFLTARLFAIELLALTIARHSRDASAIRAGLASERETMMTAMLNSPQSDNQIEATLRQIELIEEALLVESRPVDK